MKWIATMTLAANTAQNLVIPAAFTGVQLLTTAADVSFEISMDGANPQTFQTTTAHGAPLTANAAIPVGIPDATKGVPCLSAISVAGATLKVWGLW